MDFNLIDFINLTAALALPWAVGYYSLFLLMPRNPFDRWTHSALAFGLGMGLLTQWMFLLGITHIPISRDTVGLGGLTALLILFFLARKCPRRPSSPPLETARIDPLSIAMTLYIFAYIAYIIYSSLNVPLSVWDELESIGLKGKIFFTEQSLGRLNTMPHPTYPLHMPLALDWIALNLSRWDDQLIKIIVPITLICFLRVQYFFVKQFTSSRAALASVVLLLASPLVIYHSTIAYMDLTLMFYNCAVIMLLLLWKQKNEPGLFMVAGLFSGFGTFVKEEGIAYSVIHVVFLFLLTRKDTSWHTLKRNLTQFFVISLGICAVFQIFRMSLDLAILERTHVVLGIETLERFAVIIKALGRVLFLSGNWNIVWIVLLVSLSNFAEKDCRDAGRVFQALGLFFGLYILLFLLTPVYDWISVGQTDGTLCRLILHFFPLAPILIVFLNAKTHTQDQTSAV